MVSGILDPAFAALLSDPRVALRPPAADTAMAAYRNRLDRPMAAVVGPAGVSVESGVAGGVPLRRYCARATPTGTLIFLHGGGFVVGSLDTHDALCRALAIRSGAAVVAVAYRLAPEAPFPAAPDDCWAVLRAVLEDSPIKGGQIAVCGDSAGAYLATTTALRAGREGIRLDALGLFYPVVSPSCASRSWDRFGNGHMLTRDWMRWAWRGFAGDANPADPTFDLLQADLRGLPPTHILTAEFDPLRDEGEALAKAIRAAGGSATESCYAGMIHGFASLPMLTPKADDAIAEMAHHLIVNNGVD